MTPHAAGSLTAASVVRTIRTVAGTPRIFGVTTRTSRRTVDLDRGMVGVLLDWRERLASEGLACGADDWRFVNPERRHLYSNRSASSSACRVAGLRRARRAGR